MKFNNLFLVLVLIFVISLGAVSAVEDSDIETGVLATADGMSLDTAVEGDLAESGVVDESLDSSADADSVDDDLGESERIDETGVLSINDLNQNNQLKENNLEGYVNITEDNVDDYFDSDGRLIAPNNLKFKGNFDGSNMNFNMFIINETVDMDFNSAIFNDIGFNLTAPNLEIRNTYFGINNDNYLNNAVISINADNITVDNVEFLIYAPFDNDCIMIDVENSNNAILSNLDVTYLMMPQLLGTYELDNYNYIIKLVNSNYTSIVHNTFLAHLLLKSVNFNVFEFPSTDTDLVAAIAVQGSNYLNLSNNSIYVFANQQRANTLPTLDSIIIVKSNNSIVSNNNITETDLNASGSNYLYALDVYEMSNLTVYNNTINVDSNGGSTSPNGAGAAYPIQITGPIGSMYIHDNRLTTTNHGPNLGIFSQNYYGDTNLTIYNNVINVTGRATNDYYSLVSGMELEDTYAEVYNNTINVVNDLAYSSSNNIYGISYYQTTYNNPHVFKVYNNTIVTNGHYAVYLKSSSGTQVYNNSLKTYDLCCNNAVYIQSGSISDNYCTCVNCTCNSTNHCSSTNNINMASVNDMKKNNLLTASLVDLVSDEGSNEYVIYVGPNQAPDGGDGTKENPFNDLTTALNSVSSLGTAENIVNVTINFFNGTYAYSTVLKLNDYTNYVFQAMPNENVTISSIKNFQFFNQNVGTKCFRKVNGIKFEINRLRLEKCFGIIEFNNTHIITPSQQLTLDLNGGNSQKYINCTFKCKLISVMTSGLNSSNITFSHCNFIQLNGLSAYDVVCSIDHCIIMGNNYSNGGIIWGKQSSSDVQSSLNMSYSTIFDNINIGSNIHNDNCQINYNWWGRNNINESINFNYPGYEIDAPLIYAVFNTSSNYLGNNQWEIIGKLTWNDGTVDGIENFAPMNVLLSSESGTFNESNPVLENGIFKVIYTGDALTNEITATLDREVQTLTFNKVDLSVSVDDISYGEYANVTVNAPDNINGNFTVTVNNIPYTVQTAEKSFVVPITELLSGGIYTVDVVLVDAENNIYGSNSTSFEVKKAEPKDVESVLDVTVPSDATSASFSIDLPGATGNLTVTVNNKNYTKELVDGKATVDINDLPAGTYNAVITYSGDDNFAPISKNTSVTIKSAILATKLSAPKVTATYNVAKKLVITLKDANGKVLAGKKVSVKVGSISKTLKTNSKGQVSLNVAKLVPKTYTATVKFAGDSGYTASTLKPKVVVKKAKVKLAAKAKSFKAKVKTKKYTVTLKNNKGKVIKKAKLTLKVGKKTYKAKTNSKGKATFKITKLNKKGKKTATVKFAGNKYFKALSKKVKITVK